MKLSKWVAIGLRLMGGVYFLQGLGLTDFYPSFMNHDIRWSLVGIVLVIISLLIWNNQSTSK
jgi:uncharacterized membrane protein